MADVHDKATRSKNMRAIGTHDTAIEQRVAGLLTRLGLAFHVQDTALPGRPDFVIDDYQCVIFTHGCFWHHHGWEWDGRKLVQTAECPQATAPKTNRAFWNAKFRRNVQRDQEHERLWSEQGWNVIVIWECALKTVAEREKTFAKVAKWLQVLSKEKG